MTATLRPETAAELVAALRERRGPVRLVGGGSRQHRLPDPGDATRLDVRRLDAIERLDPGDQTCTVGPGTTREVLDAELVAHDLCLPCPGSGTIGGLFASDPIGDPGAGAPQPRSLLLGLEGVLADGTEFRSGARVTKSVAGFDLHRMFVGSRGRLFAVTALHLRLKPRPRASVWFEQRGLEPAAALELLLRLRAEAVPPAALHLVRDSRGCRVAGRIDGRASFVAEVLRTHGLEPGPPFEGHHLRAPAAGEVLAGAVRPSRGVAVLESAPAGAAFVMHGGGRFELALGSPQETDALLAELPGLGAHASIVEGAPDRRGRGTPLDPGQARLADAMTRALDPDGILV